MKKLLSMMLLFAILLSVCACAAEEPASTEAATEATTEATEETLPVAFQPGNGKLTDEEKFGHINQMEPIDGVYQIWNAEGVKFMMTKPEGKFQLLCNIDMQGAALQPMQEFTGHLHGGNFGILNFTLEGGNEENFGFVTVNKGTITNFLITNVTFVPGPNAKNMGAIAGINEGKITRTNPTGTMQVTTAAADASCGGVVGINKGELTNVVATVDIAYSAEGKANVGGLVGTVESGTTEYLENHGALTVTGEDKTVGLFAGISNGIVLRNCVFGGADNSLNAEPFYHFTGNPDDNELEIALKAICRDNTAEPLTEAQAKLRDRVVEEMYNICATPWKLREDLIHTCYCTLDVCHGTYNTTFTYKGIPYNHKGGSLDRFLYCLDEEGYVKDWVYDLPSFDGYDAYIGNDCSTSVLHAWWTVSNSVDFMRVRYELPQYYDIGGCLAVGGYNWDFALDSNNYTDKFFEMNTEQEMAEAYAKAHRGDLMAFVTEKGGHTVMLAEDPVVYREQDGTINTTYSYLITHEQGTRRINDEKRTYSTCWVDAKRSFGDFLGRKNIPITCEELLTGEMEPAECTISQDLPGKLGLTTGYIKANYFLDSVTLRITDSAGQEVFNHKMFTTAARRAETGDNDQIMRNYKDDYDMAYFATPLQSMQFQRGETYTYTITARLGTYDEFLLKEDTFVNG